MKPEPVPDDNSKDKEEINVLPEKKRRDIEWIKRSIIKMRHYKIFKLLKDSNVWKLVTKVWIEVNNLSSDHQEIGNIRFVRL